MLQLINISKSYDSPAGGPAQVVLRDINLNVQVGNSLSIVGPSGSGKSTLLNIIGALDKPTTGKVMLNGDDLALLNENQLAGIRNTKIGFVFQMHHLLPQCTVLENVLIPALASKNKSDIKDVRQRAIDLLERVGLKDCLRFRPAELSGGQRQRVAVVRALINKPALLLADEPTGSLDKASAENIFDLLVDLNQTQKITLIAVTHSLHLAKRLGAVMELADGVVKSGENLE